MPYRINIDEGKKRTLIAWTGVMSDEQLLECQQELWAMPEIRAFDEIADFRGLEALTVTTSGIEQLATAGAEHDSGVSKRLAIVTKNDIEFGLSRMYEAFRELAQDNHRVTKVFQGMDDAIAWLEAEPDA
ncbi:MAG: hypothetical protein VCD00_04160 [Candidatus Hydrogenedentota bacterium]